MFFCSFVYCVFAHRYFVQTFSTFYFTILHPKKLQGFCLPQNLTLVSKNYHPSLIDINLCTYCTISCKCKKVQRFFLYINCKTAYNDNHIQHNNPNWYVVWN